MTIPAVTRRSRLLGCLLVVIFWQPVYGAGHRDYHLTGVIGSDSAKTFAIIEWPDGRQSLISEGDAVDNGYVESISVPDSTVTLAFPDGKLSLVLTGSGKPNEYREEFSIADYSSEVLRQPLERAAIAELRVLANSYEKLTKQQRTAQVNVLLGLPEDARIVALNHESVDSIDETLQEFLLQLPMDTSENAHLGSISVSDVTGRRRVYLHSPVRSE